jgi:hypothetical protein
MTVDLSATGSEGPERSPIGGPSYEEVRKAARGQRKDYRLDREPIAQGGQAEVFRGVHKATQVPIALKKLVAHNDIRGAPGRTTTPPKGRSTSTSTCPLTFVPAYSLCTVVSCRKPKNVRPQLSGVWERSITSSRRSGLVGWWVRHNGVAT